MNISFFRKHKLYELRRETLGSFCKVCVEGLYALSPEVLQETLEGFINRYSTAQMQRITHARFERVRTPSQTRSHAQANAFARQGKRVRLYVASGQYCTYTCTYDLHNSTSTIFVVVAKTHIRVGVINYRLKTITQFFGPLDFSRYFSCLHTVFHTKRVEN